MLVPLNRKWPIHPPHPWFAQAHPVRICAVYSANYSFDWQSMNQKWRQYQNHSMQSIIPLGLLYLLPPNNTDSSAVYCTIWDISPAHLHDYRQRHYKIPQSRIKRFGWAVIYRPILLREFQPYLLTDVIH